jgi:hypothetical protein
MTRSDEALIESGRAPVDATQVARRINVAVSGPMLGAIDRLIEQEGVTLTEAVRRLIAYGDVVHRVTRQEGSTLLVRDATGGEREVVVL